MKPNSFINAYFGESGALLKDIYRVPGIKNKFLYIIKPPGWSQTDDPKTANKVRGKYLAQHSAAIK